MFNAQPSMKSGHTGRSFLQLLPKSPRLPNNYYLLAIAALLSLFQRILLILMKLVGGLSRGACDEGSTVSSQRSIVWNLEPWNLKINQNVKRST
jgi:hypothetical protein